MSTAYFYKLGFLTACADRGLGPDEAEALADRVLAERHAKAALLLPIGLGAGAGLGAYMSPPERRWEGAAQGAARGAGTSLGAGVGAMAGAALGGLSAAGSGFSPAMGALGGYLLGAVPGGFLGHTLAKKLTPNPAWSQKTNKTVKKDEKREKEPKAEKKTEKKAGALGVAAGLAGAPVWLAGQAFRWAGNAGAAAGLGIGRMLYGNPEDSVKPVSHKTDLTAHHERLSRIQAMTAELKRRKAELVQTPGLFA